MTEVLKDLSLPYGYDQGLLLATELGGPVQTYDQAGIVQTARDMRDAFAWNPYYKNFFATKATPRFAVLELLHQQGMGFDCSSESELLTMRKLGIPGEDIFFTSNNTARSDFELAIELGATVNIDDLTHVPVFLEALGDRSIDRVAVRYNPGKLKDGNALIGEPEEAKYGMSLDQIVAAFKLMSGAKIGEYGLHTMVASNELKPDYFAETATILLDAVDEVEASGGPEITFVNLGGGFGLNYRPEQGPFDVADAGSQIRSVFESRGKQNIQVITENGRFVTGTHGSLLTGVRYVMQKYKDYVGVDGSMNNLMRPGMYGAYHHITVLGKEDQPLTHVYDVVGSLCENNDKFAIDRPLPKTDKGDLYVMHDTGAHGTAMGFGYNGLYFAPEVLICPDGQMEIIRDKQTFEQLTGNERWNGSTDMGRLPVRVS